LRVVNAGSSDFYGKDARNAAMRRRRGMRGESPVAEARRGSSSLTNFETLLRSVRGACRVGDRAAGPNFSAPLDPCQIANPTGKHAVFMSRSEMQLISVPNSQSDQGPRAPGVFQRVSHAGGVAKGCRSAGRSAAVRPGAQR
jgi:hypothetical protein